MSEFCDQHITLTNVLTRIQSCVESIEKTILDGVAFKNGVISTLIGMSLIIVIQLSTFSYLYGKLVNQVEVNTTRLTHIESIFETK